MDAFIFGLFERPLKTFLLKLIQQWFVGRFKGLTEGYQPAWNEFVIANSYWAIAVNSNLYQQLDFGLYRGWIEAGPKLWAMFWSNGVQRMPTWKFVGHNLIIEKYIGQILPALHYMTHPVFENGTALKEIKWKYISM